MAEKVYQPGEAYQYPLLIKKLLVNPIINAPDQEIVYRDKVRHTYRTMYERINRLANGLENLGVKHGDTVCIFEFDSHRYLECFFAVPMMGAVMLLKLILGEKVTLSHCVPTIIHMLVSNPVAKKVDLSNWKVIIGGGALPKGLAKAAMELGIEIYAAYGMSETCPAVTVANLKDYMLDWDDDKKVDVLIKTGLPFAFCEVKIIDPAGNFLPHDGKATGELVLRTPSLTETYYKDPERTKDLWRDGWMRTGDIAYIDEEGYIQITDRLKDVIKTGGEWISSIDLENLMSHHEAVSESAAIGVPDEKWGERPVIVAVLKPEFKGKVSSDDFVQFMKNFADEGKIPKYGVPNRFEIVDEIPKTSVGKINKIALREKYS